jgi:hypothetical protein
MHVISADKGTCSVINEKPSSYITNSNCLSHFLVSIASWIWGEHCDEELGPFVSLQQLIILLKYIQTMKERLDSELTQAFEEVWRIGRYDELV